jgi:hypothetical protein
MKRILFLLFTALALNLSLVAQEDTTRVTEWEDTVEASDNISGSHHEQERDRPFRFGTIGDAFSKNMVAVVAVVAVFGLPVFIVFIAFFFQYKNRKARYKLAEQALAAGQPIPEEFMRSQKENNTLSKGIYNICVGFGLFIFLYAITNRFAIGTIGLLVMFTGFGQVIIHYVNNGKKDR